MIRLFHTADLHLGLKFTRGGYSPALQKQLVDQRLETLRSMVDLANARECGVFVIAGDLFDTPRVAKGLVRETAEILTRFEGIVVVLPGNHDYVQEDDPLWPPFIDALGEGHHLLSRETPCDLREQGVPLVLFPGVCGSRHSKENAVGWVTAALASLDLPDEVRRVGVAHGSLEGLSPDFSGDYFPMTRKELESPGMDVWLLGHTHVRHPDRDAFTGERVLFPATPEPDGFDCRHAGHAWIVEISEKGEVSGESVRTGRFRFRTVAKMVTGEPDLAALQSEFTTYSSETDLVKVALSGRLPGDLYDTRGEWLEALRKNALYLEDDLTGLIKEIRAADIEREFTQGSFPFRLLSGLAGEDGDPESLQIAWDLVKEAKA
jgi:DNA repair protein SbcD/Mre11